MMHAGPSITITSLTDCFAFFIGARSSILAIRAFCMFAGVTVIMLYLSQITLFLCIVAWDTKRIELRFNECCFLCFCSEDSILCCKGKMMTPNQREYFEAKGPDNCCVRLWKAYVSLLTCGCKIKRTEKPVSLFSYIRTVFL